GGGPRRRSSDGRDGGDAGQGLALEQLEAGPAAGGQVVDPVGQAERGQGGGRVAPADHGVAVGGGHRLGDRLGAGGEGGQLEHAHGPVPEHGAGLGDGGGERLGRLRADVQALPAGLDPAGGHGAGLGVLADLAGHDHV